MAGRSIRSPETGSAESSYYTWVDQFDTFGLGRDVPIATGNANESLLALVNGRFVNLRVPYPMGFYTKWMDGRIDYPAAGWKGRGPSTSRAARGRRARSSSSSSGQTRWRADAAFQNSGEILSVCRASHDELPAKATGPVRSPYCKYMYSCRFIFGTTFAITSVV